MGTLSETAVSTQKLIKFTIIGIVAIILLRTGWVALKNWWIRTHPTPPPAPTVSFGKLPNIVCPESKLDVKVTLETISGTTPTLQDQSVVFKVRSQPINLLSLEKAKEQAKQLNFLAEPEAQSKEIYVWKNQTRPTEALKMNITNGNFILEKYWQKDPALLLEKNLPGKEQAAIEAKNFLQQAGIFAEDLEEAETKVTYLKVFGSTFRPAPSLSEADFTRIDFFRRSFDELPFLTANPEEGSIYLLFSGSRINYKRIIKVLYRYFPLDYENFATYPLKSSNLAWQELEKNEGFIASLDEGITEVKVRHIYLAFFDPYEAQEFIQPVFVFEGDHNFQAFVPAISPEWRENSATDDLQKPTQ